MTWLKKEGAKWVCKECGKRPTQPPNNCTVKTHQRYYAKHGLRCSRRTMKRRAAKEEYLNKLMLERHKTIRIAHRNREELIQMLGGKCIRCGFNDIRVLELDHINDDGSIDRLIHGEGETLYAYHLSRPDYVPKHLQVLCANCHLLKKWHHTPVLNHLFQTGSVS